ncbi:MAG: dienelactone hydrolase family protein [Ktedonobacteraceae bacterium]
MSSNTPEKGPHQGQPVLTTGVALDKATAAMIMIHGRGASAEDILGLSAELQPLPVPQTGCKFVYLAPQAAQSEWYPNSFLAPIPSNEPGLSSGLAIIAALLAQVEAAGITAEHTMLLGFSQGACLALEFVARHARRYGGVIGLSGGLIGPDGMPRNYSGSLAGTPIFLGCSDIDFHIPKQRVEQSAEVLQRMGGDVTMRLYPRMGHTINRDELRIVQSMVAALAT